MFCIGGAVFWVVDLKALLYSMLCNGWQQVWSLLVNMTKCAMNNVFPIASILKIQRVKGLSRRQDVLVLPGLCALLIERSSTWSLLQCVANQYVSNLQILQKVT